MDERATRQPGEWQLVHVLRRTWWHVDEGWQGVDRAHRRRWLLTIAIGFAVLLLATIALVWIGRSLERAGMLAWEPPFIEAFEQCAPFSFGWAIWIESPGNGVVLWPLVLVASAIAAWRRQTLLALTFLFGFVLLDGAVLLGWHLWERARPSLIAGGLASSGESFSAFPSGHVSQTIVVYGLLAALWLRTTHIRAEKVFGWALVTLLAGAVALARIRLGAHWPSDIIAGALLGSLWLGVLLCALHGTAAPEGRRTSRRLISHRDEDRRHAMANNVETFTPPNTPTPIGPYNHVAKAGPFLSIGGIAGVDPATGQLAGPDVHAQARQILESFRICLESAGSDLRHVLHIHVFLKSMSDFEEMNRAYVEMMGDHRPARTVIGVSELPKPGVLLTMNLTAVTRD